MAWQAYSSAQGFRWICNPPPKKVRPLFSVGFVIPPSNNGVASIFKRPNVPVDLQSTVKKGSTFSSVGFVIPPSNNGGTSSSHRADYKSAHTIGRTFSNRGLQIHGNVRTSKSNPRERLFHGNVRTLIPPSISGTQKGGSHTGEVWASACNLCFKRGGGYSSPSSSRNWKIDEVT